MPLIEKITETYSRLRQEGIVWFIFQIGKAIRNFVLPPWNCLYWFPVKEVGDIQPFKALAVAREQFQNSVSNSKEGLKLRVVTKLSELSFEEYQALKGSVGASDIPVYEGRLAKGVELHVLFIEGEVAGTLSFVFGETQRFQHVVLTEHDAVALDGRIDPKYRGRGLYQIFLSLAIERLNQRGIERLFVDTKENNKAAIRSYSSTGFRFLLKFKIKRGGYYFDREAI